MSNAENQITKDIYVDLLPLGKDETTYRKLTDDFVSEVAFEGRTFLKIDPEAIRLLSEQAFIDINHLLRPEHLAQLAKIMDDPEATENDRYVAYDLLKNANIAAGGVLPMCQDTGTAIVMGKRGRNLLIDGSEEDAISQGIMDAYFKKNLRYSQLAPISMFEEQNTKDNLPAQIDIYSHGEDAYKFLFTAKGGGSADRKSVV